MTTDDRARRSPYEAITGEGAEAARREELRDPLSRVPLFAGFDAAHLNELAQLSRTRTAQPGDVLVREGEPGQELIVLTEGKGRIERHGQEITQLNPGDYVGEMSLLDGQPRSATIIADTPVTVIVLQKPSFDHLVATNPDLKDRLLVTLCQRLRDLHATLLD